LSFTSVHPFYLSSSVEYLGTLVVPLGTSVPTSGLSHFLLLLIMTENQNLTHREVQTQKPNPRSKWTTTGPAVSTKQTRKADRLLLPPVERVAQIGKSIKFFPKDDTIKPRRKRDGTYFTKEETIAFLTRVDKRGALAEAAKVDAMRAAKWKPPVATAPKHVVDDTPKPAKVGPITWEATPTLSPSLFPTIAELIDLFGEDPTKDAPPTEPVEAWREGLKYVNVLRARLAKMHNPKTTIQHKSYLHLKAIIDTAVNSSSDPKTVAKIIPALMDEINRVAPSQTERLRRAGISFKTKGSVNKFQNKQPTLKQQFRDRSYKKKWEIVPAPEKNIVIPERKVVHDGVITGGTYIPPVDDTVAPSNSEK